MSAATNSIGVRACSGCLRRGWLLSELSALLDYNRGRRDRLLELLRLPDENLIRALGGRRKAELKERFADFGLDRIPKSTGIGAVCPHGSGYPHALETSGPTCALHVDGSLARFDRLLQVPVVAVLGSSKPSDYGSIQAGSIARGLAASGITVLTRLGRGVAAAVHEEVASLEMGALALASDGLNPTAAPASLQRRIRARGCVLSELPLRARGRGWGPIACEGTLLGLVSLVVLVEADETAVDLATSRRAMELDVPVAALPGAVSNPLSAGPHRLLMGGASLVRDAGDVLELLFRAGPGASPRPPRSVGPVLPQHLHDVLQQVLAGKDTPEKITAGSANVGEILTRLSELEIAAVLSRVQGGRYVPLEP